MPQVEKNIEIYQMLKEQDEPDPEHIPMEAIFDTDAKESFIRKDIGEKLNFSGYYDEPKEVTYDDRFFIKNPRMIKAVGGSLLGVSVDKCKMYITARMVDKDEIEADIIIGRKDMNEHRVELKYDAKTKTYRLNVEKCLRRMKESKKTIRI